MTPAPSSQTNSARLLAEHQAAERRQLIAEMVAKFRRDNPGATQAEVDRFVDQVTKEVCR